MVIIMHTRLSFYPDISKAEKGLQLSIKKSTQCTLTICARTYDLPLNTGILSTNATVDHERFYQQIMDGISGKNSADVQFWPVT